jgi:hypothetical protein
MKQNRSLKLKPSWQNSLESLSRPEFSAALKGIRRGIEKESLRVNDDSRLASTGHPAPLGSALTHAWITTDYAEALMEFITPVGSEAEETLGILADIQRHVSRHLGDELLWPVSMPCTVEAEDDTLSFDDFLRLTLDRVPPAPSPPRSFKGKRCQWPPLLGEHAKPGEAKRPL